MYTFHDICGKKKGERNGGEVSDLFRINKTTADKDKQNTHIHTALFEYFFEKCPRDMHIRAAIDDTHSWINLGLEEVMIVVVLVLDDGWAYSNSIWLRLLLLLAVLFMVFVISDSPKI